MVDAVKDVLISFFCFILQMAGWLVFSFYLASLHEISMRGCCLVFCLNKIGIILHIVVVSCIASNLKLQQ